MNKQKQTAIDGINRKTALLDKIARTIESLPDDIPIDNIYESCEELCIAVPYDITRIRETRRVLGSHWKLIDKQHVIDSGTWFANLIKVDDPDVHVTFMADPLKEGSTCRLVKVGTKQTDVYDIVCD